MTWKTKKWFNFCEGQIYLRPLFFVQVNPLPEIGISRKQQDRIKLLPDLQSSPQSDAQEAKCRKDDETLQLMINVSWGVVALYIEKVCTSFEA